MTQKLRDHVSQARLSVKVLTVKIKIVLRTDKNTKECCHHCAHNRQERTPKEHRELTSSIIPAGTNSGALAERLDEFPAEASWARLLGGDVLFACALRWGVLCLLRSANQIGSAQLMCREDTRASVAPVLGACARRFWRSETESRSWLLTGRSRRLTRKNQPGWPTSDI